MGKTGKKLLWQGKEYTVTELARKHGLDPGTLYNRLMKGISLKDALTAPPKSPKVLASPSGESDTVQGWARKLGVSAAAIHARLRKGQNPADAIAMPPQKTLIEELERKPQPIPTYTKQAIWEEPGYTPMKPARKYQIGSEMLRYQLKPGAKTEASPENISTVPRRGKVVTTSSGETHTIKEWAEKTGIDAKIIRRRLWNGWSADDAVEAAPRDRSLKIVWDGREYNLSELARKYGIPQPTLSQRFNKGVSLEDALTTERLAKVLTASSGESNTVDGWAKKLGIPTGTIRRRMRSGWEVDEAIGIAERKRPNALSDLARRHGIHPGTLRSRLKREAPLDVALTKPPRETLTSSSGETHTIREWAEKLGINERTLRARIRKGWDVDRVLCGIDRAHSIAELARKHGISPNTLRHRLKNGFSLEEAIAKPQARSLTASNGESHTLEEWATKLGITISTLKSRINYGWSADEIVGLVERPRRYGKPELIEFQGEFLTRTEIARRLGISGEAMRQRLLRGWKPEDAFRLGNAKDAPIKRRGRPKKTPPTD